MPTLDPANAQPDARQQVVEKPQPAAKARAAKVKPKEQQTARKKTQTTTRSSGGLGD